MQPRQDLPEHPSVDSTATRIEMGLVGASPGHGFALPRGRASLPSRDKAMPDEFPYDVFLSHSAKDKAVVRPFSLSASNGAGVRCRSFVWLRADGVKAKAEFRRRKAELLHSSFFILPSPCAFGSDWAQLESGTLRAGQRPFRGPLNKERRFLPLRLDDAPQTTPTGSAKTTIDAGSPAELDPLAKGNQQGERGGVHHQFGVPPNGNANFAQVQHLPLDRASW